MKNGKIIGYTSGVYDMFHIGHLNVIKRAKQQCDYLIVGVTTDELCYKRKQKMPIINFSDRCKIVESIRYVDQVIPQENMNKINVIKKYHVAVVFVGSDWQGTSSWNEYEKEFAKYDAKVAYLSYTDGISSSILRKK